MKVHISHNKLVTTDTDTNMASKLVAGYVCITNILCK